MESVRTLIVGAGISGLAAAAALCGRGPETAAGDARCSDRCDHDYLVLEADAEIGGYCKTIRQAGFVWDYSGHFFHFKHPEIEAWLRARMPGQNIRTVEKRAFIGYKGQLIDFPFQKNIHQLPKDEFIDCLYDLYFARAPHELKPADASSPVDREANFKEMLYKRFGRAIAEKFLVPYNEKLYACDLARLDPEAMGRFFPHTNLTDIIRNMKVASNASYNSTFTYPEGGAIEYVRALASELRPATIALSEPLLAIDRDRRIARTPRRELRFDRLISSVPFNRLLTLAGVGSEPQVWSWNKVLVFNLGFDRKGPREAHWIYYPDPDCVFYRVGFYDNIFDTDRLSIYVEVGLAKDAAVDVAATRTRVLADLRRQGVITDHQLIAEHSVVMDPAYVHITRGSLAEHARQSALLRDSGVYSIGRYGGWTYCSIEDNIVEARRLIAELDPPAAPRPGQS